MSPRFPASAASAMLLALLAPVASAAASPAEAAAPLLAILPMALYARIAPPRLLDHAARRRLSEILASAPGSTTADLARRLGCSRGAVRHHLQALERASLVTPVSSGATLHYFLRGMEPSASQAPTVAILHDPSRARLVELVGSAPGALSQAELSALSGLSVRLVSHHVRRLVQAGLLAPEGSRPRRYGLPRAFTAEA